MNDEKLEEMKAIIQELVNIILATDLGWSPKISPQLGARIRQALGSDGFDSDD